MERFWNKVVISSPEKCWEWAAGKDPDGYGIIEHKVNGKWRPYKAHRLSWQLTHGDTGTLCVLHKCDNRGCVNPGHLFLGTVKDNNTDRNKKGRDNPAKGTKHCNARLDDTAIREIIESKETCYVLAEKYRVSFGHIAKIRRREAWKHIK